MNTIPSRLQTIAKLPGWLALAGLAALLITTLAPAPLRAMVSAPAGTVVLHFDPPQTTVVAGQEFQVALLVEAGSQPVDAVDAFLSFDPALLQVLELTPGSALPTVLAGSFDNATGRIGFSAGKQLGGPDPSGTFVLVTISLRTNSTAAPGSTALAFVFEPPVRNTDVFYRGQSVLGSAQNGSIVIQPDGTPCYDFDDDHLVTIKDVMIVAARFENAQAYQLQYDLNSDGVINVLDIALVAGGWNAQCG